ncbi:protein of unknown function [Luteibacter sp. UNCMF331Sha3.1]|nr:protein of unknown function [Luteibacter sp. UNCMF331Sha3.1]
MKRLRPAFAIALIGSTLSLDLHSEGGCPPGQVPQQGNGWRACIPTAPQIQSSGRAAEPIWKARWQAISVDLDKGVIGTSLDRPTRDTAERDALVDCTNKGGSACKIHISHGNACVALAVGRSRLASADGLTRSAAERGAISNCEKIGVTCEAIYSACSLPVRIQ